MLSALAANDYTSYIWTMQNSTYTTILYFICLVILITLAIQVYWNYKNFEVGKQQLLNEAQTSLDNALNAYYKNLAEEKAAKLKTASNGQITRNSSLDVLLNDISVTSNRGDEMEIFYTDTIIETDSKMGSFDTIFQTMAILDTAEQKRQMSQIFATTELDSLKNIFEMTSRIVFSITTDSLKTEKLDNYIEEELLRKNIDVPFGYIFTKENGENQISNPDALQEMSLSTFASSAYLPNNSTFQLFLANTTSTILSRNLSGILISTILIAAVIGCLFFLLKIINRQKQLAELKNDLISNITHEFKTPIATAKVALEGIQNFNQENDPVKTKNYLQVSNTQLDKLQLMVEKLLETATLGENNLHLNREEVLLVPILSELIGRHRNLVRNKIFEFTTEQQNIVISADPFHLENALNNVLDNAAKYGGNRIEVAISKEGQMVKISISDNGSSLTKGQAGQVFEKFYRVPTGNTHDVKGFGIGLYYTKNIIEKHGGSIQLLLNKQTNFIITLPKNG